MQIIKPNDYTATKAWDALDITRMNGISVRLHWTNESYKWHRNDGEEIFVVLDGQVEMFYKEKGKSLSQLLETGDIFHATVGTEHAAHPVGVARVLVIEKEGSD